VLVTALWCYLYTLCRTRECLRTFGSVCKCNVFVRMHCLIQDYISNLVLRIWIHTDVEICLCTPFACVASVVRSACIM
jgi:hypothetical protein